MDRRVGKQNEQEQIETEAAEWVILLGSDSLREIDKKNFEEWCSKSPRHLQAFEFAQTTWSELAGLRTAPGKLADDIVHPRQGARSSVHIARNTPVTSSKRSWHGAIITACIAAIVGLGGFWYGNPVTMLVADYRTSPGETRTISLPDGSSVDLASGSAITLHFNEHERRVQLLEGAAYFTAAPMGANENRRFVVQGENGTATALGTQFLVDHTSEAVEVSVAEHEVRVALMKPGSHDSDVILSAGQSVRYSEKTGIGTVHEKDVELASAWRRGRLIFDQVPLSEVVSELNRYRRGRIIISSNALAAYKVSGVFQTNDLENALRTISHELHLGMTSIPPLVTVLY